MAFSPLQSTNNSIIDAGVNANTTAGSAEVVRGIGYDSGSIVSTVALLTAIAFHVSHDGTNFYALGDASGAAVALTVTQNRGYAIPAAVFEFPFFKMVSTGASGDVSVVLTRSSRSG